MVRMEVGFAQFNAAQHAGTIAIGVYLLTLFCGKESLRVFGLQARSVDHPIFEVFQADADIVRIYSSSPSSNEISAPFG